MDRNLSSGATKVAINWGEVFTAVVYGSLFLAIVIVATN